MTEFYFWVFKANSFSFIYSLTLNLNLAMFKWPCYTSFVNQSHMWKQMTKIPSSPLCNTVQSEKQVDLDFEVSHSIPFLTLSHTQTHTHGLKPLSDPDCNWPWASQASAAKPLLIWPALIKLHTVVLSVCVSFNEDCLRNEILLNSLLSLIECSVIWV